MSPFTIDPRAGHGIFFMTPAPGESQQPGFAYLPSPRSVDEWDATLRLRPLGDHWYLAT